VATLKTGAGHITERQAPKKGHSCQQADRLT
jgi:hypothetical protein